jgi:hypothetical protein
MANTAASRLTFASASQCRGSTLGYGCGSQEHAQTTAEMATHTHTQVAHTHTQLLSGANINVQQGIADVTVAGPVSSSAGGSTTATNNNAGSGNAATITQPTLIVKKIIKH